MILFVGGLQYDMPEDMLKELFEKYGTVASVNLATTRKNTGNKGFGFIDMPDDEQALNAIKELHETVFNGKQLNVKISDDKLRKRKE